MKKLLAIVLALSMALSLATAFASEAPAYKTMTLTFNVNSQLIQMMAGGGNEPVDALISIINKLSIVALEGENNGFELSANLPNGKLFALNGAMNEDGYLVTTDLLPSYAIQIGAETLSQMMQSMAAVEQDEAQTFDLTALAELAKQYAGEPETGAFSVNGKDYVMKQPVSMDGAELMSFVGALIAMLPAEATASSLPAMPSDEEIAQADLLMQIDLYADAEGKQMAYDYTISEKSAVSQRMLLEVNASGENAATVAMYLPQNVEFETWDTAVAALNAGEDYGYSVTGGFEADDLKAPKTGKIDFVIYNGGQYMFGVKLDAAQDGCDIGLTMMSPDMPLINVKVAIGQSDTPAAAADAGERTVVDFDALSGSAENSELSAALSTDLQYGSTTLLINLIQFAPDEMTVLMNAMNPPAEEMPVEEMPVDEAPVDDMSVEEAPAA